MIMQPQSDRQLEPCRKHSCISDGTVLHLEILGRWSPQRGRRKRKWGGGKMGALSWMESGLEKGKREDRTFHQTALCVARYSSRNSRKTPTCQNLPRVLMVGTPVIYVNGPADKARPCHVWFHVGLLSHISYSLSFSVGTAYFICLEISRGK